MNPFIEVENLSFVYEDESDKIPALHNVNLKINAGEYVAVIGRNGSGKSTFAKLLNMIHEPSCGKIIVDGCDITDKNISDEELFDIRRRVGMVFQNPDNQLVATIVEDDVAFGPENLGLPSDEIRRRVDGALKTVGMENFSRHEPARLSGGQKQRIAIAGIIAMLPECIIFDESTAMLDPIGRRDIVSMMEKLNREMGITVITITHYMNEAVRADRVIVFNNGEVVADGTPDEIYSNKKLITDAGLDLPQCAALAQELRKNGIELDGACITPDKCAEAILRALSKKEVRDE
ncbi:MAG: energy-coupling factor transporter ATPase [Ruminococcaceae bacterium]|nr:energy-coupling factor transporter ATPase [Oscillospiraceae bacterium]